jgi:aminoglycoside 6'-N-acetyltransferase I
VEPSITIQQVGSELFETAFYLLERFFREEGFSTPAQEMRTSLQTMIAAQNSAVFLGWCGTEAVGVATVTSSVGIEYGQSAEMEDLYVLPEKRGVGVASALIEAVCAWCREQGVSVLLVTVTPEGETEYRLLDFYQQRGFTNTKRIILERTLGGDSHEMPKASNLPPGLASGNE